MRTGAPAKSQSLFMVLILLSSVAIMGAQPPIQDDLEGITMSSETGINQDASMPIYGLNGSSSALKAEVPNGHTVESIDLNLQPDALAFNDAISLSGESHWNASGALLDRIDVNKSDGLQLLPQEWSWGFENSNHGWTLQSAGGWAWGYDSGLGPTNGVHSGTKALYTYNGNYPNGMSTTYWATSPAVDCSGCSGSWTLNFWKRLGVEYHYYDHAYVQIKNPQGNWIQLYSNVGSVSDSSYQQVTYSIGQHVQNNPSLQVRFGLGTTDSSVTYTGWNLDDVKISPSQGAGGGEQANWTSARFGPGVSGNYHTEGHRYGIVSVDATIPDSSNLMLSILDGVSKTPIPGFSNLDTTWVDLGSIDSERHPSLRVKLNLDIRNGGTTPIVHAVHLNHRYSTSFNSNPESAGGSASANPTSSWSLNSMSWNGNSISGTGSIVSPIFTSHRTITQLGVSTSGSGNWATSVSLDSGSWQQIPNNGIHTFTERSSTIQVKLACNSGSCTFNDVEFDIIGGHLPTNPAFDIGLDGWNEWESSHPHISAWGWQDRFTNGDISADFNWAAAGVKQVGVMLPKSGLDKLSVVLSPYSSTDPVTVSFSLNGQPIMSKSVTFSSGSETVELSNSELLDFNQNLSTALTNWAAVGGLEYTIATVDIDGTYGSIRVGGLSAIYSPIAELSFNSDSAFVLSMNQGLLDAQIQSQNRLVPIHLRSSTAGSALGTITDLVTASNVALENYEIRNFSSNTPVTPSWQWMEIDAHYSWDSGVAESLIVDLETDEIRTIYRFPVDGSSVEMLNSLMGASSSIESPLIFKDESGGAIFEHNSNGINVTLPFRTNASLEDSSGFKISASLYMEDGAPSPPLLERSGLGLNLGVENDLDVLGWDVYNGLGLAIPQSMSYLKSNSPIIIEAQLGFEDLSDSSKNPRSGDVKVHLLENNVELMNTTTLDKGRASFSISTPLGTGDVNYSIIVEPLAGQDFTSDMVMNRTFTVDSLSPQVVGQNIARYDHRTSSLSQFISVEVYDRPVLPTHLELMVWREWVDDSNNNGLMEPSEYIAMPLNAPNNLELARGNYTMTLDDSGASSGDLVTAYLVGADPAGNEVTEGGANTSDAQLFTYQVLPDGPPSLPAEGGFEGAPDGRLAYLHPGVDYSFSLHIVEPNGWSDIAELRLQLASNSLTDTLAIEWSASDGHCHVLSQHMVVANCGVQAWSGELTPFNSELKFFVDFQLNWTLPSEGDMRWEPSVEVTDRSGQGAWLSLPQLRWRYSPDLAIDTESITLTIGSGTYSDEGAWVAPNSPVTLSGMVHFPLTGTTPSSPFNLRLLLDGQESILESVNGAWSISQQSPILAGSYPLTIELANIPSGANDVTDSSETLRWIVVDPDGPEPIEVISPRPSSQLPIESLGAVEIEVIISELEQINSENLFLHWKVIRGSDVRATPLAFGESTMVVSGGNLAGQSIIATTSLNLIESIPEQYHSDELYLHIWVTGSDMAGNNMQTPNGANIDENPFASWPIERRAPVFILDDDVTYSRSGDVSAGENVMITISVRNEGEVDGTARVRLTEIHLDENLNRELTAVPIEISVSAGGRTLHHIDWQPEDTGRQWIVVTLEDGTAVNGPTINIVGAEESSFLGSIFEGVNIVWTILFIGLMILLASVVLIAIRSGGSAESALHGTDDMWDEDSSYEYFEESNVDTPEPTPAPEIVIPATITAPHEFPLDYTDDTVKHVIKQHGIHDVNGFLLYAKDFDADNNGYLKQAELEQAAESFVRAGTQAEPTSSGPPAPIDLANMTPEQMAWYEQAKKWGGYYDEAGNWVPL